MAVTDLSAVDLDPHLRILFESGWRSVLAVPMLREEQIVGALVVRRKRTGTFTTETVELLESTQTGIARALDEGSRGAVTLLQAGGREAVG